MQLNKIKFIIMLFPLFAYGVLAEYFYRRSFDASKLSAQQEQIYSA